MGKLVDGKWLTDEQLRAFEESQYQESNGRFQRGTAVFRNWVTADGNAGPTGDAGFKTEEGRYHLFAALNCPWAHRTLIYRSIKRLEGVISLSLVKPLRNENGWVFDHKTTRFKDELYGQAALHEIYVRAVPNFTGRVTVPVLWDRQQETIVSNESSDIIRMFNSAFNEITCDSQNFYPHDLAEDIDKLNDYIYHNLNNAVYQTGFARTQEAYDESVVKVFDALDALEERLAERRFLLGERITEADWRLFPTLIRFDVGYYTAFKCNIRALRDYSNLSRYLKELYAFPGVGKTVDLDIYRAGYNSKSPVRNPYGIVPVGLEPKLS